LVRDIWWEAGWAAKDPSQALGIDSDNLALDLASNNINEIFHLDIDYETSCSVWEGRSFDYGATPVVVFNRGKIERCYPGFE